MNKYDLNNLRFRIDYWSNSIPKNKYTIAAYIEGFEMAKSPKKYDDSYKYFSEYFEEFIFRKYHIKHFTWYEQIETYAYRNKKDWVLAFTKLFNQFIKEFPENTNPNRFYISSAIYNSKIEIKITDFNVNFLDTIKIGKQIIKNGTLLKLSNLIQEDYKESYHYDIELKDPSWDLYETSEKDFSFVKLCYIGNFEKENKLSKITFGRARRICSDSILEVKKIVEKNGKYYIYTDNFEIEIESALKNKEIKFVHEKDPLGVKIDNHFKMTLKEIAVNYCVGVVGESAINSLYSDLMCKLDWVNYRYTYGGWMKISRSS